MRIIFPSPFTSAKHNLSDSKLGEISTDLEVKQRKSARRVGIDHFLSGETALHLVSSSNVLYIGILW
jgi:hypothetical protein